MIDEITCDTDISMIIKESDVEVNLQEIKNIVDYYKKEITSTMDNEIISGGLSKSSFSASDEAPINKSALDILSRVTENDAADNIREKTISLLSEQRTKEIEKLKSKVEEKIRDLRSEYSNTLSILKELKLLIKSDDKSSRFYQQQKNDIMNEIKKYEDKLAVVMEMK